MHIVPLNTSHPVWTKIYTTFPSHDTSAEIINEKKGCNFGFLSFFLSYDTFDHYIMPGSANLEFWSKNKQTKQNRKKKNKKNLSAVFD